MTDFTVDFNESSVSYSKQVLSSTCIGVAAGFAGNFTATSVSRTGTSIDFDTLTGIDGSLVTALTWAPSPACPATTKATQTLDSSNSAVDTPAPGQIQIQIQTNYDPSGC